MKNNFWSLIWKSFLEIQGFTLGILGLIISLLAWFFSEQKKISFTLTVFLIILIIVIFTLIKAINQLLKNTNKLQDEIKSLKENNQTLEQEIGNLVNPPIIIVKKDTTKNVIRCLLENSSLFTVNVLLSFYYEDADGFQRFIAIGVVESVQDNGKIQVIVDENEIVTEYQTIFERLVNNEQAVKKATFVRLGIPRDRDFRR